MKDISRHVSVTTWCLPHEAALLSNPYAYLEFGFVSANGIGIGTMASAALLDRFRQQQELYSNSWDAGRNVVGLA